MAQYLNLPRNAKDLTGRRFGRLVAIGAVGIDKSRAIVWRCLCDCGKESDTNSTRLLNGSCQSCGCLGAERRRVANTTHGMADTRIHTRWTRMIRRCHYPSDNTYSYYGARGISVCHEWRNSFEAYYSYVSKLPHYGEKGYTIDRVDNDGNYEPGNVRWATTTEQMQNTRRNHFITFDGKTLCLSEWSRELKIHEHTLAKRIDMGWSIERVLTTPVARSKRALEIAAERVEAE